MDCKQLPDYYRPETKFAKVMFSQVSLSTGEVPTPLHGGIHPLWDQRQTRPLGRHPPAQCILGNTHPPCPVHAGIHTPSLPSACWDTHIPCPVHVGIHTPLPSACRDTYPLPSACWDTHPLCNACWDTVNKRAVRIPLECILVLEAMALMVSPSPWSGSLW